MKRDMDLIRKILLAMEEHEHGFAPNRLEIEGYTAEQIGYHAYLMHDAGLIHAVNVTSQQSPGPWALPRRLKAAGHDFLDNSRDPSLWESAKARAKQLGGLALPLWLELLKDLARRQLGLP